MPDDRLMPAVRAALRLHEIGNASPYQLFFAGKGKSGASFGFMQGDLAAGQPEVRQTFRKALAASGVATQDITNIAKRLSVHLIANPLGPGETQRVNDALLVARTLVDAMDESLLSKVRASLDTCIATASGAGHAVAPKALIYMALWINMTGPPTKLLTWLAGSDPGLRKPLPPPGGEVDGAAMEAYLRATDYFSENPGNLAHMLNCAAEGAALLGPLATAEGAVASPEPGGATAGAVPGLEGTHFTYEQATGRMFLSEGGSHDLFATGYSGSDQHGGKNNPHAQCEQDIGPLPRGSYTIGRPVAGPSPFSLPLTPAPDNDMCGRSAFLIHGDAINAPGTASHGCIILARPARESIAASGTDQLRVVAQIA